MTILNTSLLNNKKESLAGIVSLRIFAFMIDFDVI